MRQIEIFDSSLRDGAQGKQISFSVADKLAVARALDAQGVHYIEAGNPASNPKDMAFFERACELDLRTSKLVAFGATRRKGIAAAEDAGLQAVLSAGTDVVCIFGKAWAMQVTEVLGTTPEENLKMIGESVAFLRASGRQVFFDAEHFFDGYMNNPEYAMAALRAAAENGASHLVLCDTRGAALPDAVGEITAKVCAAFPDCTVGVHCHDDIGCAVASSIAAVEAGAGHLQGTFIGIGERCGNTNLSIAIPTLQLKLGYHCVPDSKLENLTKTARQIAEIANYILPDNLPYVGAGAFSHKAGMHIDAVHKSKESFEHIDPASVGNHRHILVSEVGGRATTVHAIKKIDPQAAGDSNVVAAVLNDIKQREARGFAYESAEASLQLLILRHLDWYKPHFDVEMFRIIGEQVAGTFHPSSAMIKVAVGDQVEMTAAEGRGPVNALDAALRKAVSRFYPAIEKVRLTDFKVRVVDGSASTAARVRVLIEFTDGDSVWSTVGASRDIVRASLRAQRDALNYKLLKDDGVLKP